MGKITTYLRKIVLVILGVYRYLISPLLGDCCRFYPSCSQYTSTAIEQFGIMRGGWLALKRLIRCHPGCPGGIDPVPNQIDRQR